MEETEYSFQIVKVSFCQEGDRESQLVRGRGRTLVSIHSDRDDISILVCLTEFYCYQLSQWLMHIISIKEHKLDIYINQNSQGLCRSKPLNVTSCSTCAVFTKWHLVYENFPEMTT